MACCSLCAGGGYQEEVEAGIPLNGMVIGGFSQVGGLLLSVYCASCGGGYQEEVKAVKAE